MTNEKKRSNRAPRSSRAVARLCVQNQYHSSTTRSEAELACLRGMFHRDARDARRRASERTARRKDASESHIAPASGAFIARRAHRAHRAPPLDSAARPFPPLARALATRDDERDDATRRDVTRIDSIRTALERRSSREREREEGRDARARVATTSTGPREPRASREGGTRRVTTLGCDPTPRSHRRAS